MVSTPRRYLIMHNPRTNTASSQSGLIHQCGNSVQKLSKFFLEYRQIKLRVKKLMAEST